MIVVVIAQSELCCELDCNELDSIELDCSELD